MYVEYLNIVRDIDEKDLDSYLDRGYKIYQPEQKVDKKPVVRPPK